MKKTFATSLLSVFCAMIITSGAMAAIPWWMQPTICKPNPTNCYPSMGMGYDTGMWDASGNCWGLKMICPEALTRTTSNPEAMGKLDIVNGTGIKTDFDTNVLNGDCFGTRKTIANGSQASVNGKYVNVWCNGVLESADELLPTGEITLGAQPTCRDLAPNGFIAVLNQKCYGKYYDPGKYFIECDGNSVMPKRIVQLNGADAIIGTSGGGYDYPENTTAAKSLFDQMQAVSKSQKSEHFQQ